MFDNIKYGLYKMGVANLSLGVAKSSKGGPGAAKAPTLKIGEGEKQ